MVFDVGEHDQQPYLVMERLEGQTLKHRLDEGPIELNEALKLATQIAAALQAAHAQGIIHRDIKPANIFITSEGYAKVLDFGLAKRLESGQEAEEDLSSALTRAGATLGTLAYMSPEQLRGKELDARTDIFSFGVVLYEMLTGVHPFRQESTNETVSAIINNEIRPLASYVNNTPDAVQHVLRKMLAKTPGRRHGTMQGVRNDLEQLLEDSGRQALLSGEQLHADPDMPSAGVSRRRFGQHWIWVLMTLIGLGSALILGVAYLTKTSTPGGLVHFVIDAPEGWTFARSTSATFFVPMVSPDGRQVVFAAVSENSQGSERMLWIRSLESVSARPLPGTEGVEGIGPFWSPDGRSIGFASGGTLYKIDVDNGTIETICTLPRGQWFGGCDWSRDGTILFSLGGEEGLIFSVAATGGVAKQLMTLDSSRAEINHLLPQFLPDGRRFLFLLGAAKQEHGGLYLAELDAPENRQRVAPEVLFQRYAAEQLLSARNGTLYAQSFDAGRAEPVGEPRVIAHSVAPQQWNFEAGVFNASSETLAYFSGVAPSGETQLAWSDRKGRILQKIGQPDAYGQISLAPDNRSAAVEIRVDDGEYDLWLMDMTRGVSSRLTFAPGEERDPVWSPDGQSLAFTTRGEEGAELRRKGLRAGETEEVVANSEDEDIPESWLQDGKKMLVVRRSADNKQSVWAVPVEGGEDAELVLDNEFRVDEPQISPDGRWLAFVSPESGRDEVYVQPYRRQGLRLQVSVAGGGQPKWRSDGKELYYINYERQLMAVAVRGEGDQLAVELPTKLFQVESIQGSGYDDYAVADNGQRFLVKLPTDESIEPRLHIMVNWPSLLE
jgi:Tol biopolymer transport system component